MSFWYAKPPSGTALAWSNPALVGVHDLWSMQEGAGARIANLVRPSADGVVSGTALWSGLEDGVAANYNGSTYHATGTYSVGYADPNVMTFAVIARCDGNPASGRFSLYGVDDTASAVQFELGNNGENANFMAFIAGTVIARTAANAVVQGRTHRIVYVRRGAGATHEIWIDGVSMTLTAKASDSYLDSSAIRSIGRRSSGSQLWNGSISQMMLCGRAWTEHQITTWTSDPYQIFAPPVWRRYFVVSEAPPPPTMRRTLPLLGVS